MQELFNRFPNIPGQLVEFKDGGYSARVNDAEVDTDSILLLGTAVDGPVGEAIAVDHNDVDGVRRIFGSDVDSNGTSNGATLFKFYKQASELGCRDIRLMRVTGTPATASVKAADKVVSEQIKHEEELGIVGGNDETTITLTCEEKIQEATVKVYVKGMLLAKGSKYTNGNKQIVIEANACDAGSPITVTYDYDKDEQVTGESILVEEDRSVTLDFTPKSKEHVTVNDHEGHEIENSKYALQGNKITFSDGPNAGEIVSVDYTHVVVHSARESGTPERPFMTATSSQMFTLREKPVVGTVMLYINESLITNTEFFTVDEVKKQINIKKEHFEKGFTVGISCFVEKEIVEKRELHLESRFGGSIYNGGMLEVVKVTDSNGSPIGKAIRVTKPDSKKHINEEPMVLPSYKYKTLGEIVQAINENHPTFKASTTSDTTLVEDLNISKVYLIGGDDGVNVSKIDMFKALSGERDEKGFLIKHGAYQILENYKVDWIVPLGVHADDELPGKNQDFAYELALACAVYSTRNKTTQGAISVKPCRDRSLLGLQKRTDYLANLRNTYILKDEKGHEMYNEDNEPVMDLGKFISVCASDIYVDNQIYASREGNPALAYACLNCGLLPNSSPMNKLMPKVTLQYNFSNYQLNKILGNRIVMFGTKFSKTGRALKGAYVIDGPTSARIGSRYAKTITLKVCRVIADDIREAGDIFIGEQPTVENQNALSAAIAKRLDARLRQGVILDYSFNIITSARDSNLGLCKIEYTLVTPIELRGITSVLGLKR